VFSVAAAMPGLVLLRWLRAQVTALEPARDPVASPHAEPSAEPAPAQARGG